MDQFLQLTMSGLTNGAIYALVAVGFVLIYKASDVINFAQGEFLLVGAYVAAFLIGDLGLAWPIGAVLTVVIAAAMGVVIERLVLRPLIGEPIISVIMVTIGLSSLLRSIVLGIWGTNPKVFPAFFPKTEVDIFGAVVTTEKLGAIAVAAAFLLIFTLFFRYTREGIAMRAVADDQQAALSMGISVKRIFAMAWSISAITAAIAGVVVANTLEVSGNLSAIGLTVFPVVILGGLDSIPGALIGAAIIGLLEAYTGGYVGDGSLSQVIPYIVLVLILMLRPYGLFGKEIIERV
ncbi:MAG: branched-chain amino acid ABC transporter permease [Chloroflexi bacterium]|nr:MAG: branched-chain amino acid ABC transporter permease [Chloroflexota bacterium]